MLLTDFSLVSNIWRDKKLFVRIQELIFYANSDLMKRLDYFLLLNLDGEINIEYNIELPIMQYYDIWTRLNVELLDW